MINIHQFTTAKVSSAASIVAHVYTPDSPLRHPVCFLRDMFRDLRRSRELAWRLFVRDITAQYRQSILGYIWAFVPPIMASLPFIFLSAGGVLAIHGTEVPYPAYAMIGTVVWQTFADALTSPMKTVLAAKSILVKINLPREAILLSGLGQVILAALIRLILLIMVLAWFAIVPAPTAFLFPVGVAALIIVGFTVGLALTPVALLYGDVQQMLPVATTFLMLLTPVVYPAPQTGWAAGVVNWNPLSPLIIVTREWLTIGEASQMAAFFAVTITSMCLLFVGWVVYRLALPHIIARVGN